MNRRVLSRALVTSSLSVGFLGGIALAWLPLQVANDPLVRMPGTQPGQGADLESPNRCFNCHTDYDPAVDPGAHWEGSMMAQASRDFLFWACFTVSGQDSIWAVGNPNAMDLCERCHFPEGWLSGRSDPPNASLMVGSDYDGVHCDFCHQMYDPFFATTHDGTREGDDWAGYWDETGALSQTLADETYLEDEALSESVVLFNGAPFFGIDDRPFSPSYTENASGQFFVSTAADKRASFSDAAARHKMLYSRYHKSKYFCATCHDVSNPVLANLGQDGTAPLTTETHAAFSYFDVERTFSEFMLSDFGVQGGAPGTGAFAPAVFATSHPGNAIATCQDCHLRDVVGAGANKASAVVRPTESTDHPQSGQPLHDMTGGNVWVSAVLASAIPGSPNHDPVNEALLSQGPAALTLDLSEGLGIDPEHLLDGADRAQQQLLVAATIDDLVYDPGAGAITFKVRNHTGHKLISGFPEGRRMFVNVKVYAGGGIIHEVNPYDDGVGTLKGLPAEYSPNSPPLGPNEVHVDELVYECHPESSLTGEDQSFHFVLADGRHKDNRIPPRGFRIAEAAARRAEPAWNGNSAPGYFTAAEYAGGYDEVTVPIPGGGDAVVVELLYQTTSREYVEFLRDEINGVGTTLSSPTPSGEPEAYIIQSDPFFSRLAAWGNTIWSLWDHNKDLPGAYPALMVRAALDPSGRHVKTPVHKL